MIYWMGFWEVSFFLSFYLSIFLSYSIPVRNSSNSISLYTGMFNTTRKCSTTFRIETKENNKYQRPEGIQFIISNGPKNPFPHLLRQQVFPCYPSFEERERFERGNEENNYGRISGERNWNRYKEEEGNLTYFG